MFFNRVEAFIRSQRIVLRSPCSVLFFLLSALITLSDDAGKRSLSATNFVDPFVVSWWVRLLCHPLVHANMQHLFNNMTLFMVLGPSFESRLGARRFCYVVFGCAVAEGVVNALISDYYLIGASGVVFMFILMFPLHTHATDITQREIPVAFLLVALLYIGQEIIHIRRNDGISHTCHIVGGLCGALLGLASRRPRRTSKRYAWKKIFDYFSRS